MFKTVFEMFVLKPIGSEARFIFRNDLPVAGDVNRPYHGFRRQISFTEIELWTTYEYYCKIKILGNTR